MRGSYLSHRDLLGCFEEVLGSLVVSLLRLLGGLHLLAALFPLLRM